MFFSSHNQLFYFAILHDFPLSFLLSFSFKSLLTETILYFFFRFFYDI